MDKKYRTGDDWWYKARDAATYTGLPMSLLSALARHGLLRRTWWLSRGALYRKSSLDVLMNCKIQEEVAEMNR